MAFAATTSPAIAVTAPTTYFTYLPSLLQQQFSRRSQTNTTVAFSARRLRGVNPSLHRSRSKTAPAQEESFGALEVELWRLRRRAELRLQRLAAEADEAYSDLRSAVRVVGGDRVVLTFRRSSLRFAASALLWSFALSAAAWAFLGLSLRAWRRQLRGRGWWGGREGGAIVTKRDRSLGGKEVVVAVSSPVAAPVPRVPEPAKGVRRRKPQERVPEWWPKMGTEEVDPGLEVEKWGRLANGLVRAIIDNRIAGRDYRYDDAIQRMLVILSIGQQQTLFWMIAAAQDMGGAQINGENPRIFLAGLAKNIGLDKFRAAKLVCASVAARTRACLLQSWALEVQGKRQETLDELVKICRIHCIFPPEENSAEMEMVAGGLKRNLQVAERVHLLSLYRSICTAGNFRTAAEALGLSLVD